MNVFIFADTLSIKTDHGTSTTEANRMTERHNSEYQQRSFVGIGGFRNRRVVLMNHQALMQGVRYGEIWNPRRHYETICLSLRETQQTNQLLDRIGRRIKSQFQGVESREVGFYSFLTSNDSDLSILRQLIRLQFALENEFGIRFFIGAGPDRMTARLSCLTAGSLPRITKPALLKSLMCQIPFEVLGIPRKIECLLKKQELYSPDKLRQLSLSQLRKVLGQNHEKYALDLFKILRGIDPIKIHSKKLIQKLIQRINFEQPIFDPLTLYLAIENRWQDFQKILSQLSTSDIQISINFRSNLGAIKSIQILEPEFGEFKNEKNWRRSLRNAIFGSVFKTPLNSINLVAEYRPDNLINHKNQLRSSYRQEQPRFRLERYSNISTKIRPRNESCFLKINVAALQNLNTQRQQLKHLNCS